MKKKFFTSAVSIMIILALTTAPLLSFAETSTSLGTNNYKADLEKIEKVLNEKYPTKSRSSILPYMTEAVGQDDMVKAISNYKDDSVNEDQAYEKIAANLARVYQEVECQDFSEEQTKLLFTSAANLETGNAEVNEMSYSSETPTFAPSHEADIAWMKDKENQNSVDVSVRGATDISGRNSYATDGMGYEAMSLPGYNQTTTFLYAGKSNITEPQGKAGYQFYTIYYNNYYQDLGIGYFGGKWQAFVNGGYTGWGTGTITTKPGDYLYFKLWIGTDNKMNFQILDGNNFSRIIFQNSYGTTKNPIPSSGSGVSFNKQTTIVDDSKRANSGISLTNATFVNSYLYNSSSTKQFLDATTEKTRRGRFGSSWAPYTKVLVTGVSGWYTETVSLTV